MILDDDTVMAHLMAGGTIVEQRPLNAGSVTNPKITYYLSQNGDQIGVNVMARIKRDLEPVGDGLFPNGPSQNYKLKGVMLSKAEVASYNDEN